MISQLALMRQQLVEMEQRIRADKTLPHPDYAVELNAELHATRCALVALDTALHARHNERHPFKPVALDCGCVIAQELDAATRAEIDATP